MTAISAEPRWGLAAGSTRGLLGKILLLGFVAAIAVAMAIPLFTGGKTPFLVSGPWAIADIEKAKVNYDVCAIPSFAGGKPASPFIGVNGFYLASKGKNKTLAQEFLTSVVPTADFQSGLYAVDPRRPALTESATAAAATDPNIPKFADAGANGTILPAIPEMGQVWSPFGIAEAAIVGGTDPTTALTAAAKAIREGIANQ